MADLVVNYVNIGQGDCTLIVCPDGKTRIMIDNGAVNGALGKDCVDLKQEKDKAKAKWTQLKRIKPRNQPLNYAKQLKDAEKAMKQAEKDYEAQKNADNSATDAGVQTALAAFLGGQKKIDHLLLTHHDADHYNKVAYLKLDGITFGKVYYSGPIQMYKQLRANYPAPDLVDEYISITINGKAQADQTMIDKDAVDVTVTCQTGKKTIYTKAATKSSPKCTVDILASNVQTNPADQGKSVKGFHFDAGDINGRSIVTLVTYGTDKILIMGDATTETEDFLVSTYGTSLQSDTLRVGHHGSDSSSSKAFIEKVKPDIAIISSSISNTYNLPTATIIDRYITYFNKQSLSVDEHEVVYYTDVTYSDRYTAKDIKQPLWQTWSLASTETSYTGS